MNCIVHGVTKSQTRLSNFNFTSLQLRLHLPLWQFRSKTGQCWNIKVQFICLHLGHLWGWSQQQCSPQYQMWSLQLPNASPISLLPDKCCFWDYALHANLHLYFQKFDLRQYSSLRESIYHYSIMEEEILFPKLIFTLKKNNNNQCEIPSGDYRTYINFCSFDDKPASGESLPQWTGTLPNNY